MHAFIQKLPEESVIIFSDGSDDNDKEKVQHILVGGRFGAHILNIIYHSAEICIDVKRLIDDVEDTKNELKDELKMDIDLAAYVHDNENKDKAAARLFCDKYAREDYGCAAHGWNKVNEQLFKRFPELRVIKNLLIDVIKRVNKGNVRDILSKNILFDRIKRRMLKKESLRLKRN